MNMRKGSKLMAQALGATRNFSVSPQAERKVAVLGAAGDHACCLLIALRKDMNAAKFSRRQPTLADLICMCLSVEISSRPPTLHYTPNLEYLERNQQVSRRWYWTTSWSAHEGGISHNPTSLGLTFLVSPCISFLT